MKILKKILTAATITSLMAAAYAQPDNDPESKAYKNTHEISDTLKEAEEKLGEVEKNVGNLEQEKNNLKSENENLKRVYRQFELGTPEMLKDFVEKAADDIIAENAFEYRACDVQSKLNTSISEKELQSFQREHTKNVEAKKVAKGLYTYSGKEFPFTIKFVFGERDFRVVILDSIAGYPPLNVDVNGRLARFANDCLAFEYNGKLYVINLATKLHSKMARAKFFKEGKAIQMAVFSVDNNILLDDKPVKSRERFTCPTRPSQKQDVQSEIHENDKVIVEKRNTEDHRFIEVQDETGHHPDHFAYTYGFRYPDSHYRSNTQKIKEGANHMKEGIKEKAHNMKEGIKEKAHDVKEAIREKVHNVAGKIKDKTASDEEKSQENVDNQKENDKNKNERLEASMRKLVNDMRG